MQQLRFPPAILIVVIWLGGLGAAAQFAKISIVFSQLQIHYDSFGVASGLLLSIISFFGIIFGLVAGLIGARIGYRKLLLIGMSVGAITSLSQALMPSFGLMMMSRVVEGASHLAIVVAAPTLISGIATPAQQGFALTLWGTFFGLAFAVTAAIAPTLLAMGDLPAIFAAHGLYMALLSAILAASLPKLVQPTNGQALVPSLGEFIRLHARTYASAFVSAPAIGWVFYTLTFVSAITVLPRYLPSEHLTLVVAAMPLASITSSMTLGVLLLRHMSAVSVVQTGFASSFLCIIWFGIDPANPIAPVALFACLGLVQGASFAAVPQINEKIDDRARAYGALAQMGNLGNTCGTPLLLVAISMGGRIGIVVFIGLCYVFAIASHAALAKARRQTGPG